MFVEYTDEQLRLAVVSSFSCNSTLKFLNLKSHSSNRMRLRIDIARLKLDTSHWTHKRVRTGPIWKLPKDELKSLVESSKSFTEILKFFGMPVLGGHYYSLKERLEFESLDYSHIDGNQNRKDAIKKELIPLNLAMIENSTYSRQSLKRRLLREKILKNECSKCKQQPIWQEEQLVLVLDHINGVRDDNRLENLRLLCPNCNSQTSTFGGRKLKTFYNCSECRKGISGAGATSKCIKCLTKEKLQDGVIKRKFEVSKEELEILVWASPMTKIGEKFGVTDNSVRKRCKLLGIRYPGRGFWQKLKAGKINI